jgi:hypothetical protein
MGAAAKAEPEIQPLPHPDLHFLHWAEGWLELGNAREAHLELEQIRPDRRGHPDVLALRWQIYANEQNWSDCLVLALSWTEQLPNDPRGWMALARTFYHRKEVAEAYAVCAAKAHDFAGCWELLYETARYACRLNRRKEAKQFLHFAIAVGHEKVKLRALGDPELAALCAAVP